jgi:hypothetical protein
MERSHSEIHTYHFKGPGFESPCNFVFYHLEINSKDNVLFCQPCKTPKCPKYCFFQVVMNDHYACRHKIIKPAFEECFVIYGRLLKDLCVADIVESYYISEKEQQ